MIKSDTKMFKNIFLVGSDIITEFLHISDFNGTRKLTHLNYRNIYLYFLHVIINLFKQKFQI